MTNKRPLAGLLSKIVLGTALAASLSGCVALAVGGAAATALASNDRRTIGMQTEDKSINVKAEIKMQQLTGENGHVNVTSYNRKVLLTGEVRDEAMKQAAEREVRAIDNVVSVINELEIAGPSSYTSRSNDALITTKVKASLVDAKDISANSFKVVTEHGAVYLMGRVTQREATQAAEIARGVNGVNKVVKVFEYISEDEWKQYQPKPAQ